MKNRKAKIKEMSLRDKAIAAMEEAIAAVVEDHRRRNIPLAIWRNGKVVMLPPEKAKRQHSASKYCNILK